MKKFLKWLVTVIALLLVVFNDEPGVMGGGVLLAFALIFNAYQRYRVVADLNEEPIHQCWYPSNFFKMFTYRRPFSPVRYVTVVWGLVVAANIFFVSTGLVFWITIGITMITGVTVSAVTSLRNSYKLLLQGYSTYEVYRRLVNDAF